MDEMNNVMNDEVFAPVAEEIVNRGISKGGMIALGSICIAGVAAAGTFVYKKVIKPKLDAKEGRRVRVETVDYQEEDSDIETE